MSEYSARDLAGRWVLDERGRPLGQLVGVVHHWNGRNSLLVECGSGRSRSGMMVSPDRAIIVGRDVHLRPPAPQPASAGLSERIGRLMWPSGSRSYR